jgi:hypothetical protein
MSDKYNSVRKAIYEKHPIKLEQTAIIASCKLCLLEGEFIPELNYKTQEDWLTHIELLENGDRIFIRIYSNEGDNELDKLLDYIHKKNIKLDFVVFAEPILPMNTLNKLLVYSRDIFLTNNTYDIPNVHNMPLGIITSNLSNIYKCSVLSLEKKYLCILGFSYTSGDRKSCYETLAHKDFITNLNNQAKEATELSRVCYFCDKSQHLANTSCEEKKKISSSLDIFKEPSHSFGLISTLNVNAFILSKYRKESYFTLHPRGAGEECHSFYESLFLDSVPIVKKTNTYYDKVFSVLPCLVVDDWNDVTEKLLVEMKDLYQERLRKFKEDHPNFFTDIEYIFSFLRKNL